MRKAFSVPQLMRLTLISIAMAALVPGCAHSNRPSASTARDSAQDSFATADQAVQALVDALRSGDTARLKQILGPGSDQIISSGDQIADQRNRQKFVDRFEEKHALIAGANGVMTLNVGKNDWPLPIPLVSDARGWRFDTEAGLEEILSRRIGRNELDAIQVCLAITDAERDYVQRNPTGADLPEYAQKFFSDPGQKNGLYWPTNATEQPAPLGPLVADAANQGYTKRTSADAGPRPYHGYYYRILKSQGPDATGGACDYVVNGKMIGGFAVIARPAEYSNSGIMTFIVNHRGIVYQKDLGPDTASLADSITAFDPDSSWQKAQ
jgi:Protein of unknown function (DUF2950)